MYIVVCMIQLYDSVCIKFIALFDKSFLIILGQEYPAVVEFAPFQRIPKRRPNRKKDPKIGTIESSPIFISFKEKLEAELQENKTSGNSIKQHFFETSTSNICCL